MVCDGRNPVVHYCRVYNYPRYLAQPQYSIFSFLCVFCFRGFGFITFGDPASVDKVLAQGTHELDGKKVCKVIYIY